jgi:hypothetical protein
VVQLGSGGFGRDRKTKSTAETRDVKRKREDVKTDAIEEQRVSERESEMCAGFDPERDEAMRRRQCTQDGVCGRRIEIEMKAYVCGATVACEAKRTTNSNNDPLKAYGFRRSRFAG